MNSEKRLNNSQKIRLFAFVFEMESPYCDGNIHQKNIGLFI